jgi:hypothetical protein
LGKSVKGDVVVVPFPFSDLSQAKRRPAMVVADLEGDDLLLSQDKDFASGGLRQKSNIRPNRLFIADRHIVLYKAGHLKVEKLREVISKIVEIVQR